MRGDIENIKLLNLILDSMMKNIAVIDSKVANGAVVFHVNITDYKLIEYFVRL